MVNAIAAEVAKLAIKKLVIGAPSHSMFTRYFQSLMINLNKYHGLVYKVVRFIFLLLISWHLVMVSMCLSGNLRVCPRKSRPAHRVSALSMQYQKENCHQYVHLILRQLEAVEMTIVIHVQL